MPPRQVFLLDEDKGHEAFAVLPSWNEDLIGVKAFTYFPGAEEPYKSLYSKIMLFNRGHGEPLALVDAFPRENGLMWDAATSGNWDKALEIYRWYMPMLHFDSHPKLVQYVKLASAEMGYGTEIVRPPRLPLIGEQREEALKIIRESAATRPS